VLGIVGALLLERVVGLITGTLERLIKGARTRPGPATT
jgi:hypothetical protein